MPGLLGLAALARWTGLPGVWTVSHVGNHGACLALRRMLQAGLANRGTIIQDSRTPLTVWFAAAWYMVADPGGVSALTVQRLLGLGSFQTAWTTLHRYRSAMVRSGRELLAGRVEVDETFIGGVHPGLRGRGALGKTLVAIAVELNEPRGFGRARMSIIAAADTKTLRTFLTTTVEPGPTIVTEGLAAMP